MPFSLGTESLQEKYSVARASGRFRCSCLVVEELPHTLRGGSGNLQSQPTSGLRRNLIYTILCYAILYYTILYYTILYCTILYYTILYYTILYYTILYYTILYYTILYYTILYYTILYYTRLVGLPRSTEHPGSSGTLGSLGRPWEVLGSPSLGLYDALPVTTAKLFLEIACSLVKCIYKKEQGFASLEMAVETTGNFGVILILTHSRACSCFILGL